MKVRAPLPASRPQVRRRLRIAVWLVVGVAAAWLLFGRTARVRLTPAESAPAAPQLALTDAGGRGVDLREFRGRVVLVNLWAAWCGPCRAEIPRLNRLEADFGPAGLTVLGINVENPSPVELGRLARGLGISYTVARPEGALRGALRPAGPIPQTWWIDRAGRVRASYVGLVPEAALRQACELLLQEKEG